ncbi:MBL fold metallo-hydrolase [Paenibacillus solisilvae]|uniref:MBL fold metallo-hydrolase n=1 Tax=Paenibacillus solisilvae TaxID=2486751 RepID=A0ABW0VZX4_9BACL
MVELLFLGTSAGIPTAKRHSSGTAIKKDDKLYLIDCGGPVCSQLKKMNEDPKNIEAVFITHWHPDHAGGLPILIQDLQLSGRTKSLTIYGPKGTDRKVKLLQNIFIIPQEIYNFELKTKEYDEKTVYSDESIDFRFFKTRHLSDDYWKQLDAKHNFEIDPVAYGFMVQFDGKKIVFSGDLLNSDDLIPVLPGAELVIHEFGHINPNLLRTFTRKHDIPKLIINHIHHDWDSRDQELKEVISAEFQGEVHIAHDLWRTTI